MILENYLTLAILFLALGLFAWNRLRVDVVGLIVLAAVVLTGLVDPQRAVSGFSNEAVITVAAMFVLSSGLLRTGAIDVLGRVVARLGGTSEFRLLLVSLGIVVILSAFINNTPVVVVMIPVVIGIARQASHAPSRLLMPISFGSQLGGTLTLIGTSTNLLVSGLIVELGLPRLGLFDFTIPALLVAVGGIAYLLSVGRLLLPVRESATDLLATYELREYMTGLGIRSDSPLVGKSLRESRLREDLGLNVVAIDRAGKQISSPGGGTVMAAGDVLIAGGRVADIARIADIEHLDILGAEPPNPIFSGSSESPPSETRLAEVIVPPRSPVIGRTLRQLYFRGRYGVPVLGMQRHGVTLTEAVGDVPLRAGDTLLVEGTATELQRLHRSRDLALLGALDLPTRRTRKMKLAILIMLAVTSVAAIDLLPIMVASLLGVIAMFVTGCVKPEEAYEDVDWMVLVLLGSLIPLGIAMQSSGTAELIARHVLGIAGDLGPIGVLATFYVLTSLLTEAISNNATAIVMTPIAVATAASMGLSPLPFVIGVMFAASNSFMTPVGYQTNTFVYAPGGYRFSDFLRVGFPLALITAALSVFLIPMFFPF